MTSAVWRIQHYNTQKPGAQELHRTIGRGVLDLAIDSVLYLGTLRIVVLSLLRLNVLWKPLTVCFFLRRTLDIDVNQNAPVRGKRYHGDSMRSTQLRYEAATSRAGSRGESCDLDPHLQDGERASREAKGHGIVHSTVSILCWGFPSGQPAQSCDTSAPTPFV